MNHREVTLLTLAQGAIPELVDKELTAIYENIDDPNSEALASRSLTIRVTFKPKKDRSNIDVKLKVAKTLADPVEIESTMIVTRQGGKLRGFTTDLPQVDLFEKGEVPEHKLATI